MRGTLERKDDSLRDRLQSLIDRFDWDGYAKRLQAPFARLYRRVVFDQAERTMRLIEERRSRRREAGGAPPARKAAIAFDRDDPAMRREMTDYVGRRIKELSKTTKTAVSDLIRSILDEEGGTGSTGELGDRILERVRETFAGYEDWRADRIARTETAVAYNHGTVYASRQAGIRRVEVSDGDGDEVCARANGQIWTLEEALANPVAHPNCTRAFSPVFEDDEE